jgi:alpha-mannosidase
MLAVPGAQCLRPMATEYALVSLEDGNPADLLRLGQAYRAPLPAYQYDHPPEQRSYSYLSVEGDRVVMTALKPPQEGEGWLVRLLNPTDEPAEATLIAHARLSGAELVTLAEEAQAEFELENPEQVHLTLEPHKITTLRLRFQ